MSKIQIPHDAIVFIGDGRKALFLRNHGDEKFPNLRTERVFVDTNPPTHEQGTERPAAVSPAWVPGEAPSSRPIGITLSSTGSCARYRQRLRSWCASKT